MELPPRRVEWGGQHRALWPGGAGLPCGGRVWAEGRVPEWGVSQGWACWGRCAVALGAGLPCRGPVWVEGRGPGRGLLGGASCGQGGGAA